ncbi:hypothetical protein AVEN_187972-1, partial [Araneus ventricosus]
MCTKEYIRLRSSLTAATRRLVSTSTMHRRLHEGEPGTRYHPSNIRERDAYGGSSICVWGGISLDGRTDLQVFPSGTVNAQAYRDYILDAYVCPYARPTGDDFLLQDDNASQHRDDYLQQGTIQRMEWPAVSLDPSPIKHVWDALGKRIAALNPLPQTLAMLLWRTVLRHLTLMYISRYPPPDMGNSFCL